MKSKSELISQNNREALVKEINKLLIINYDGVSGLLPKLLAEGSLKLDHSVYTIADATTIQAHGIGRYLVYDHPDKANPFSIWIFAFAPRQKTSIHDHKYKGTVTVLEGPVSEKYYQSTTEGSARLVSRVDRHKFHSNRDDLDSNFVHQLKRRKGLGEGISITLHIYNMEAQLINQFGDIIDRRNLDNIYFKDKTIDKSSIPPYEEQYSDSFCQDYKP